MALERVVRFAVRVIMLALLLASVLAAPPVPGPGRLSDPVYTFNPGAQDPSAVAVTLMGDVWESRFAGSAGVRVGVSERVAVASQLSTSAGWSLAAPITLVDGIARMSVVPTLEVAQTDGLIASAGVVGALGVGDGPASLALNVGATTAGVLTGSMAGSVHPSDALALHAELWARPSTKRSPVPNELVLHLRYRLAHRVTVNVGGATALVAESNDPAYRLFAGLTVRLGGRPDADRDGIIDTEDDCAEHPEVVNGYLDDDGCPDSLGWVAFTVRDPDGAPLPDAEVLLGDRAPTRTNARGRAVFDDLIPDDLATYTIRAASPLYRDVTGQLGPHDEETIYEHSLAWAPWVVRVTVVEATGTPMPAEVSWFGPERSTGTFAAPDGVGHVALGPGTHRFTALVDGYSLGDATVDTKQDGLTSITLTVMQVTPE